MVSAEDLAKAEGELKVAVAQIHEAEEQKAVAEAELNLAKQILKEHTIVAPFDGVVIKRMKNPGESVRANEAVVEIGKLSTRCWANAYVPLEARLQGPGGSGRRDPARVDTLEGGKEEIESQASGARSPSSIPRSRPSPRPPGGSGPSSTTPTSG